jgi:hypothetical protein
MVYLRIGKDFVQASAATLGNSCRLLARTLFREPAHNVAKNQHNDGDDKADPTGRIK